MNGSSLFMWSGHHGISWDVLGQAMAVNSFGWASRTDGLGLHWVVERYVNRSGANSDHCPVVVVRGTSANKRNELYYDAGFADRIDGGASSGTSYYYVADCDPAEGDPL